MIDKIIMGGMSFHGYHGVFGAEKELGQKFLVDVEAFLDLRAAGCRSSFIHSFIHSYFHVINSHSLSLRSLVCSLTTGQSDDLKQTLNYVMIYNDIKHIIEGKKYNLLERVADQIARTILQNYKMKKVMVRVKKPQVAVPGVVNYLGVEIERTPRDYHIE